jgi:glycosyltransferase involved in cell wall biosynthesis
MRFVALAHRYVPHCGAGAETMLHGMLRALVRRGIDVDVSLSMQTGTPYEVEGVKVWPRDVSTFRAGHAKFVPGADVLMGHLENTHPAMFLGYLNQIPVVLLHHNSFSLTKEALHFPQGRVDLSVVNSQWMADDLAEWHRLEGLRSPAVAVIRPLVDPAEYATTPGDRVTLVNLRRFTDDSGFGMRMGKGGETFWALAERMPRTRFLGVTGGYGRQAEGDLPNVEVLPHTPAQDMRDKVYARTRILLVPSSYESWGRVASEALCSGIPVIAHPTPGLQENLGDAGIYVDWRDVDGYERELRRLARPAAYVKASAAATARAAEHQRMRADDEERWIAAVERLGAGRLVAA